jgi:hypothetical protein
LIKLEYDYIYILIKRRNFLLELIKDIISLKATQIIERTAGNSIKGSRDYTENENIQLS